MDFLRSAAPLQTPLRLTRPCLVPPAAAAPASRRRAEAALVVWDTSRRQLRRPRLANPPQRARAASRPRGGCGLAAACGLLVGVAEARGTCAAGLASGRPEQGRPCLRLEAYPAGCIVVLSAAQRGAPPWAPGLHAGRPGCMLVPSGRAEAVSRALTIQCALAPRPYVQRGAIRSAGQAAGHEAGPAEEAGGGCGDEGGGCGDAGREAGPAVEAGGGCGAQHGRNRRVAGSRQLCLPRAAWVLGRLPDHQR